MEFPSEAAATPRGRLGRLVEERPFAAFAALAFAISWFCLVVFVLTQWRPVLYLAGLGPAAAGAIMSLHLGTMRQWWGRITRWRVSPWYYAYALGVPVLLYGAANLVATLYGAEFEAPRLQDLAPAYAATWGAVLLLSGLEEPGWRGFGLPTLLARLSPVQATLLVGLVWGLWQLPISPLAALVTVPLSFFYTWLFNRTGSVLLCILLHASAGPAQDNLVFVDDEIGFQTAAVVTLIAAAAGLVLATRGRLGLRDPADDSPPG